MVIFFKMNVLGFYPKCLSSFPFYLGSTTVLVCFTSELCVLNDIALKYVFCLESFLLCNSLIEIKL